MKWHYIDTEGNPQKAGVYWTALIFPEIRDGKDTGRTMVNVETRYFGDAMESKGWIMQDQPEEGLVWTEQSFSWDREKVWAWAELSETPFPERIPDGVYKYEG